jgi:integrase
MSGDGLRWSELVGLRVKDIDLAARRLYVQRAAPEMEGRIVIGRPKTRAGIRTVPLPQVVVDVFNRRINGRAPDEPAVTSPNGAMLRSNNWRRQTHWNKALKKTDLAPLTIHELRQVATNLDQLHATEIQTTKTGQEPDESNQSSSA